MRILRIGDAALVLRQNQSRPLGRTFEHRLSAREKECNTILIVILVLALCGALPRWSHSRDWSFYPSGGVGLILLVVVILLVFGRI